MNVKSQQKLNFSQLVNYINKYNITNYHYYSNKGTLVSVGKDGKIWNRPNIDPDETFIVTTKDKYTIDSKIPVLLVENISGIYREYRNASINSLPFFKSNFEQYYNIYVINNDNTHTLIWHDGEML